MRQHLRSMGPSCERAVVDFARTNAGMLAVSLSFALVAYGYELVNFSPSLDEEVAPTFAQLGEGNSWNMAVYRWGATALNFALIGGGNLPFLRLFLALCLLSITATIYAGMLPTTREARYFFCMTFVTVPTFAYALTFSFISIEFVVACLLFVLGLKSLLDGGDVDRRARAAVALLLWVLAASFYQDYGIVLAAYAVLLLFRVAADERVVGVRELSLFAGVLVASVAVYFATSMALVWVLSVPRQGYLGAFLSSSGKRADVMTFLRGVRDVYFSDAVYGTRSLRVAAIGLPLLALTSRVSAGRRMALLGLSCAIVVAPFIYGLGAIPPMRASSGLLFVAAGFCAFAVARSATSIRFFAKCFVLYLALWNCVAIANIFEHENAAWAADQALAINLMQRIYDVAPDVHDDDKNVRVLFVGSYRRKLASELAGSQSWVGMFNTWDVNKVSRRKFAMNRVGFPDFRLASSADYEANMDAIERMPAWPNAESVARSGEVVIVKLGPANGFSVY